MCNQSSRLQLWLALVTTLCTKKKSAILDFLFLAPSPWHNSSTSFVKFSFDFFIIFIIFPYHRTTSSVHRTVVVDDEKTFNWGEKRENWKNYSDKEYSKDGDGRDGNKGGEVGGGSVFTPKWRLKLSLSLPVYWTAAGQERGMAVGDFYSFWKIAITIYLYARARTKSQLLTIQNAACEWQKCFHRA